MVEATLEANPPHPTNATVLRGNLTLSDGDAVLSTALPWDTRCGQAREQRLEEKR